jgi:hypothetical protein
VPVGILSALTSGTASERPPQVCVSLTRSRRPFFSTRTPLRPLCSGSFSSLENFQEAPADMMSRARLGTRLAGPAPSPREWGLSGCRPGPGPPRPWRGHWPGPATPAPGRGALLPPEPGPELTERGHWFPLAGSGSSRGPGRHVVTGYYPVTCATAMQCGKDANSSCRRRHWQERPGVRVSEALSPA